MNLQSVIVLSIEEAREALVQFYADTIINDRPNLVEMIRENRLDRIVPNVPQLTSKQVADLCGELNLFQNLARSKQVPQVLVEVDCTYEIVFDIDNLEPENRWYVSKTVLK